jgi:hypothetical protein
MALTTLGKPPAEPKAEPPVPIKQTIKPDYIISLEDGRRYKSMKRPLSSRGITPVQYREKWGLRPDYPMVAPNYSKARSELAKALGLGQVRKAGKKGARKKASTKRMTGHLDGRAGSALPTPTYVRTASAKPADGVTTALPLRSSPAPTVVSY